MFIFLFKPTRSDYYIQPHPTTSDCNTYQIFHIRAVVKHINEHLQVQDAEVEQSGWRH